MGDMGDVFRGMQEDRKALRLRLGVNCPGCQKVQPKRIPTILLPGQRCKVCGHRDERKREAGHG